MEMKKMDPVEEPPTLLWGLDPVFSACAKLYIKDILEMAESTQVPGNIYNLNVIVNINALYIHLDYWQCGLLYLTVCST